MEYASIFFPNNKISQHNFFDLKSKINSADSYASKGHRQGRWPKGCSPLLYGRQSTGIRSTRNKLETLMLEEIYLLTFSTSYITSWEIFISRFYCTKIALMLQYFILWVVWTHFFGEMGREIETVHWRDVEEEGLLLPETWESSLTPPPLLPSRV